MKKATYIWLDGELVPWDDANIHVMTHTLHYGLGAFEGIRCYKRADGRSAVFRLDGHMKRLLESCKIVTLKSPYNRQQLIDATVETIRANELGSCYIRPLVFVGHGAMGLYAIDNPTRVMIAAWEWGAYLGDEALNHGIRAKVSSYTRPGVNAFMARGKIVGQYVNSILAKREAVKSGYHEAILLDGNGYVTEASGENIFAVRNGKVTTTPLGASILAGITRDTSITLLRELGYEVIEGRMTRDDLYVADEVFFTGTAAEVTPVREIDDREIGEPGPICKALQARYFDIVRGSAADHHEWLTWID